MTQQATTQFEPQSDLLGYRRALGRFATGVAIVTAMSERGPVGMTINSFASVSLTPPLVLWSPAKSSNRHKVFAAASHFAIHVLSADQKGICDHFIKSADGFEQFGQSTSSSGVPILPGCAAVFECEQRAIHDAGDHSIIIAEVRLVHTGEGSALVYVNGQFERAG